MPGAAEISWKPTLSIWWPCSSATFGVGAAVVWGGILCVASVGLPAALLPSFRHYDSRTR